MRAGRDRQSLAENAVGPLARPLPAAQLLVQLALGYEWFASGLSKLLRGDFPGGLAATLHSDAKPAGWYRSFLDAVVIPHAHVFGYAIEVTELLTGSVLIAGALVMLLHRARTSARACVALLLASGGAALAGIIMAVNFHLAMGTAQPWALPAASFDEAVDLDSLIVALQLALLAVSIAALLSLHRARRPTKGGV